MSFYCDDIEQTVAQLKRRGVEFVQAVEDHGYGLVTYQTAWLKANYPVQYLAALLTSVKSNLDKAAVYLGECRQRDIPVLVPDVNSSFSDFSCEGNAIRFGL